MIEQLFKGTMLIKVQTNGRRGRAESSERTCGAIDVEYSYRNNATYDNGLERFDSELVNMYVLIITYKTNGEQQESLYTRISPVQSEHAESHDCC